MAYDHEHSPVAAEQARTSGDVDYLLKLLNDPDAEARESAAYNLGKLGDRRGVPILARRLEAASEGMRLAVLGALATIGDPGASPEVFEVATGDSSFRVRAAAVSTLMAFGDDRAGSVVAGMLEDPEARRARRFEKWSLEVLVKTHHADAVPALERRARNTGWLGRRRIRKAIASLQTNDPSDPGGQNRGRA